MTKEKQDRCWPGYEPVKGKKPHSQGSCRPEAESKLTPSEKKFRGKRKRQLGEWKAGHPGTRKSAAQHLQAPGTKTKTEATKTAKKAVKTTKKKSAAKATSTTRKRKTAGK